MLNCKTNKSLKLSIKLFNRMLMSHLDKKHRSSCQLPVKRTKPDQISLKFMNVLALNRSKIYGFFSSIYWLRCNRLAQNIPNECMKYISINSSFVVMRYAVCSVCIAYTNHSSIQSIPHQFIIYL